YGPYELHVQEGGDSAEQHRLYQVRWIYGRSVLRAHGSGVDGLFCAYGCADLRPARERWRAAGDGDDDRELPVRQADAPDRHLQPEGRQDDAELDAGLSAGAETDQT